MQSVHHWQTAAAPERRDGSDSWHSTGGRESNAHRRWDHRLRNPLVSFGAVAELPDSGTSPFAGRQAQPHRAGSPDSDGKPDLSGIWGLSCPVGNNAYGTLYGQPNVYCATEVAIPPEFTNIGQSLKDGPPYQPWAAELVKKTRAANRPNDPMSRCLPPGIVRLRRVPLVSEDGPDSRSARHPERTERQLPADLHRWTAAACGSESVLERLLFGKMGRGNFGRPDRRFPRRDLDGHGRQSTHRCRPVTERFRRVNYGTLEIELTIDDPKAYTKPWTILVKQILSTRYGATGLHLPGKREGRPALGK